MIQGVVIKSKKKIQDARGAVYHMLKEDDPEFIRFGEIYFSLIKSKVIKAWKLHTKMTLNYAVIKGSIRFISPASWGSVEQFATIADSLLIPLNPVQMPGGITTKE